MSGAKRILTSLLPVNSLINNSVSTQVTRFSNPSNPLYAQQRLFLSSTPVQDLVLSNDWSKKLEHKLSKINPNNFTQENVVNVLERLDQYPLKAYNFFRWIIEKTKVKSNSASYCLLLQILARKDSMKEFWVTVNKMKELGFCVDEATYKTILIRFKGFKMFCDSSAWTHFYTRTSRDNAVDSLVKEVVEIVTSYEWGHDVEERLLMMKICMSDNFVRRVLKELRWCPLTAMRIFKWFAEGGGFDHNTGTYNAILRVLGRYGSIEEFWSMLKEMKIEGHDLDIDTYLRISRRFHKFKLLNDAVRLYEHMMDGPYKISVHECSLLLRIISKNSNPDMNLVFRVVEKFEAAGQSLCKTGYDGIHRSLTRVGRFDEAEKIMESMRNAGYEPDNKTYGQLIYGLGKVGRVVEACKVLDLMEANGCVPDLKTWTILIQGQCAVGEVDKALFYFVKMMQKNCDADADLLDVIITGFLNQKRIAIAYNLLVELVCEARLRPWQATYKNLIHHLVGESRVEEALHILHLMRKHNYTPFPEPFLQYISKFGTVEDALDFLNALSLKEYPTVAAYQHIFQSFCKEGRHSEAKDLFDRCPLHIRKHQAISSLFGSGESKCAATA